MRNDESYPNPEVNEVSTETIYKTEKPPSSHIPTCRIVYENGKPASLKTELRDYEIDVKEETTSSKEFFKHDVEYFEDGTIKSIHFTDADACTYITNLLESYRVERVKTMAQTLALELQLEHMDKPGKYSSLQKEWDNLTVRSVGRAAIEGNSPTDNITELVTKIAEEAVRPAVPLERLQYHFEVKDNAILFKKDDTYADLTIEMLELVQTLSEKDFPISKHDMVIKMGKSSTTIHRVLLGQLDLQDEQKHTVDERVAEKVLFAANVFHNPVPETINIFDDNYFETNKNSRFLRPTSQRFLQTSGKIMQGNIFLSQRARRVIDSIEYEEDSNELTVQSHLVTRQNKIRELADHEAGHVIDININLTTRPQREGFAQAVESGFVFRRELYKLRGPEWNENKNTYEYEYSTKITTEMLDQILSYNPPERFSNREIYHLSGTFFCWLYEKVGPENFKQFYNDLCGNYGKQGNNIIERQAYDIIDTPLQIKYKGKLFNCLDAIPHDHNWKWENSKQLVEDYIKDVNQGM